MTSTSANEKTVSSYDVLTRNKEEERTILFKLCLCRMERNSTFSFCLCLRRYQNQALGAKVHAVLHPSVKEKFLKPI